MKRILLIIGNCVAAIGIYCVLDSVFFKSYQATTQYFPETTGLGLMIFATYLGLPIVGISMLLFKSWYMKAVGIVYLFFFLWAVELLTHALV